MKCETLQTRLLSVADPRRLPEDVRMHVAGCPACWAFHAKLVRLEGLLAAIPVPPASADAKAALLDQVAAPGPIITRIPPSSGLRVKAGKMCEMMPKPGTIAM